MEEQTPNETKSVPMANNSRQAPYKNKNEREKMERGTRLHDMWGVGTLNHILFSCIVARFTWTCLKEAFGWDRIPAN